MRFAVRAVDRLVEALAVVLLLSLLAAVVLGVIFRQLGDPLAWSDEMAQYLLVWTGFVGWVIATRRRSHIRIDALASRLPGAAQKGLEALVQAAVAALGLGLAVHAVRLIERNWDVEAVSLPVPTGLLYLPLPFVGAVVALQALFELSAVLRGRPLRSASAAEAIT
ncbi:TRAP transporter small permease [Prosthecomicrobium sp. N25]|uniref:TRAP transporter small permease n=1 Tax=Prosthecomicrobium sp. N25 TaxID=3129254 RepID=UPI003077DBCB